MNNSIQSAEDIAGMRVAGRLASEVLDFITPYVRPGITTEELDRLCNDYMIRVQSATPACLGYAFPGNTPYPKSICTSVNHEVAHAIPGPYPLRDGDIVNIDVTVIKDGYHGDTSRMFHVGAPSPAARRLCEIAYECMWAGISEVRAGAYMGDIGHAIECCAAAYGVSNVRGLCGHSIGKRFHERPYVWHYGPRGARERLEPGMIFTIEPLINAGSPDIRTLEDGWTIVTCDGNLSAQWEHTLLVTDDGFELLTVSAGTPARPELKTLLDA